MELTPAQIFRKLYRTEPQVHCFAPGRVNLIGEHTDYNGGHVFPCAIHLGIECAACRRNDRKLRFYSANFPNVGIIESSLDNLSTDGHWTDYVKSVIHTFRQFGYPLKYGADFVFSGNLPDGAGLSSSASLEILTGVVLKELYNIPVTGQELAAFGQFAENRFIGVSCGIMDQFASAMGRKNHGLLLNTNTLDFEYAPLNGNDSALVIINSGVKHSLASSAYNDRRRECEKALVSIQKVTDVPSLCALTPAQFEHIKNVISDPICRKRAKHAVYENQRTLDAVSSLKNGDLFNLGQLMNESHKSLRYDYEVSCTELDVLVEAAQKLDGVYGARMTGGGFGGCTINLVQKKKVEDFVFSMQKIFYNAFRKDAPIYVVEISDGARLIPLE